MNKTLNLISIMLIMASLLGFICVKYLYLDDLEIRIQGVRANIDQIKLDTSFKEKKEALSILKSILTKVSIESFPEYVWKNLLQKYEEDKKYIKYYLANGAFGQGMVSCSVRGEISTSSVELLYPGIYALTLSASIFYNSVVPYKSLAKVLRFLTKKKALLISSLDLTKNKVNIKFKILGVLNFIDKNFKKNLIKR